MCVFILFWGGRGLTLQKCKPGFSSFLAILYIFKLYTINFGAGHAGWASIEINSFVGKFLTNLGNSEHLSFC